MFILCHAAKNEPRKRAKGPNALWIPAVRLCRRAERAARRKSKHLQRLRARLKESRTHSSSTQEQKLKLRPLLPPPTPAKPLPKNDLALSACRSWWLHGERCTKNIMSFSLPFFAERQCQGDPRGNVLACFLVTSCHETRSNTKKPHSAARSCTRVNRKSC